MRHASEHYACDLPDLDSADVSTAAQSHLPVTAWPGGHAKRLPQCILGRAQVVTVLQCKMSEVKVIAECILPLLYSLPRPLHSGITIQAQFNLHAHHEGTMMKEHAGAAFIKATLVGM